MRSKISASEHSHLTSTEHCHDIIRTCTHRSKRIKIRAKYNILHKWLKPPSIKQIVPFPGIVFEKLQGRENLGDINADGVIVIMCINNVLGK